MPAPPISRHKCLVYDGELSEQLPVVVPLLLDGLRDEWRCLYLGSPDALTMIDGALASKGVDTETEKDRGALVLSSDRSHLDGGRFEPEVMVDGLRSAIDDALRDGFRGLCATGDMSWELGDDDRNFDQLLEYEARLEQVFRDKPLRGICQYHRRLVPAHAVRDALLTHRTAYVGEVLNRDNLFYVPPELLLEGAMGARQGEWMCEQILRVQDAERSRDDVLRDLERLVEERTAELAVANEQLRAFSYSVSHDLRAPLRAVVGFAHAIQEDSGDRLDDEGRRNLERILAGGKRMSELIDGLLSLGRVVETNMDRAPVDFSALAEDVVRELRESSPERRVDVVVQPGLAVVGDRVLLRALLTNLLGNAWKFTSRREGARIEVGERAADGVLFVRDDGAGFDPSFAKKLFGAFQRLHSQEDFPGTGVGLATVERIVSRHGGRIWAEGAANAGATFFFTLPRT